jgi:type IV pilus assembly protein PilF
MIRVIGPKFIPSLARMYFQDGSMSVALDELRIALAADSSYFQAYSVRGLVYGALFKGIWQG